MLTMPKLGPKFIAKKYLKLRDSLWPNLAPDDLWTRHGTAGFTSIPRTMPLMLQIMDDMSKGMPLGTTYFELWCRAHDEYIVVLDKTEQIAFHAGFSGQRALSSFRTRLKRLKELKFIDIEEGPSGPYSYVLVYNPYKVIKRHHAKKTPGLTKAAYNALQQRAIDIRASDLDDMPAPPIPATNGPDKQKVAP
jgi:hypothetical protein